MAKKEEKPCSTCLLKPIFWLIPGKYPIPTLIPKAVAKAASRYITANFFYIAASYTVPEQNPVTYLAFQNVVHLKVITE